MGTADSPSKCVSKDIRAPLVVEYVGATSNWTRRNCTGSVADACSISPAGSEERRIPQGRQASPPHHTSLTDLARGPAPPVRARPAAPLHGIVGNWGWAIVLLTILVKLAFFPLQAASYRSMAKMRKVQPKLNAIRERYGDDRMKMNQAMMDLYKTEKINPLGGCLPILVQIPVFIALYWVLLASVEIRNAPWIGWIKDLSSPDPWYILPILMAGTMFLQTHLNPKPADPVQAKMMMWMPLVFSVMFFFFPSGLVLYWVVSNIFSIIQQWVITRKIEGKPVFGRAPD